ncbi:MAG: Mth938-like domain-containing protein [Spirochaetia bacterium]
MAGPRIEAYQFGSITVDGQKYREDLILFPGGVQSSWWRKKGHSLASEDLKTVFEAEPELLIIGTGNIGRMKIPDPVKEEIEGRNIELFTAPTGEAVEKYNAEREKRKVVGAFHLTC